jgi:hypothetical protein
MSENNPANLPPEERAADILDQESPDVIQSMARMLAVSIGQSAMQESQSRAAFEIIGEHVANEHKNRCLQLESSERLAQMKQRPMLLGIAIVGVLAVSFLFLHFNRPEFIVAVFTAAGGFAAGYGSRPKPRK